MADEVDDPRSGQRVVFRRTEGDLLELDLFVSRGAFVREHIHPLQEETLTGVAGTFVQVVDGETHRIGPGDSVVIPPRTPHHFDSAPEDAQLLVTVRPALELDRFFRAYLGLSRDGLLTIPERGMPKPFLLFAALLYRYRREMAMPRIPLCSSGRSSGRWLCSDARSGAGLRFRSTALSSASRAGRACARMP